MKTEIERTTHTPGPWEIYAGTAIVQAGKTQRLAWCPEESQTGGAVAFWETRANARLMAAAPEMIHALELAQAELRKHGCECDCENLPARCVVCAVNAAIEKTQA